MELRKNDYRLDEDQEVLRDSLRDLLARHCDIGTVRDAEPLGHSPDLWARLSASGIAGLGVAEEFEGQGAGLVELAIAAGETGRALAPVPFVDHSVAMRALTRAAQRPDSIDLVDYARGSKIATFLPRPFQSGAELVPSGALATCLVAWHDGQLVALIRPEPPAQAENDYGVPVAWWRLDDPLVERLVLDDGSTAHAAWIIARDEWRCLTAAQLSHLTRRAGQIAQEYALERTAFGKRIAEFQAVSHLLVGIDVAATSAENIAVKAAWYGEFEPTVRPELATIALVNAIRTANRHTIDAIQVHGGFGITLEADVTVFYRRAQAWAAAGGPMRDLLADLDPLVDRVAERDRSLQSEGAR